MKKRRINYGTADNNNRGKTKLRKRIRSKRGPEW